MPFPTSPAIAVSHVPPSRPPEIAQGIFAAHSCPIRQRRSREHNRTREVWICRGHHHDLPAGLAIPDDCRLTVGVWMAGDHCFDESCLGPANVFHGLAGHRLRHEADEIAGVTAARATPISLSFFMPPIPGPWPARGSTTMSGLAVGSVRVPGGGLILDEPDSSPGEEAYVRR